MRSGAPRTACWHKSGMCHAASTTAMDVATFSTRTRVICYRVSTALAYTFRRALESQSQTMFSRLSPHRVAPICTLRTHSTLAAEQVPAHSVNSRCAARANKAEDTCLLQAVEEKRSTCDQVIHFPIVSQWRHGIICCFLCNIRVQ